MNKPILMAAVALVALIGSAFAVPAFQIANAQYPGGGGSSPSSLEQQLKLAKEKISNAKPAGVNMTTGSNMTGANTTVHGSSIPTTNPAGVHVNRP